MSLIARAAAAHADRMESARKTEEIEQRRRTQIELVLDRILIERMETFAASQGEQLVTLEITSTARYFRVSDLVFSVRLFGHADRAKLWSVR